MYKDSGNPITAKQRCIGPAQILKRQDDMVVDFNDCALSGVDTKELVFEVLSSICDVSNGVHFMEESDSYDPNYEYALFCWDVEKKEEDNYENREYPTVALSVNPTVFEDYLDFKSDWFTIYFRRYAANTNGLRKIATLLHELAVSDVFDEKTYEASLVERGISRQDAAKAVQALKHAWEAIANKLERLLDEEK